jgi:signal transduction histidine kinase
MGARARSRHTDRRGLGTTVRDGGSQGPRRRVADPCAARVAGDHPVTFGADRHGGVSPDRPSAPPVPSPSGDRDPPADLYDFASIGFLTLDPRGVVRDLNRTAAALLGRERADLLGAPLAPGLAGADVPAFFQHLRGVIAGADPCECEMRLARPDARRVDVLFRMGAEPAEPGTAPRVRVALVDLTELRRLEREGLQTQAQIAHIQRVSTVGEMASAMAHELRQPLFAVAGFLDACLSRLEAGDVPVSLARDLAGHLADALERARWAGEVLDRYRGFVRPRPPEPRAVEVAAAIDRARALLEVEARWNGCALTRGPVPEGLAVTADPLQLEQVLVNLIKNAVDATASGTALPGGRAVTVSALPVADRQVEIRVADNGPGFVPDAMDHAFEPFFTTKPGGLGMGLSICHTIVEQHGGSITLAAEPGGGARVSVVLPRSNPAGKEPSDA